MSDELTIDRPVTGEVQKSYSKNVPQLGPQEFLAEIDRALATPGVVGLVWDQYTPYFNDGDPCEFSLSEVRVLTGVGDVDEDGERDYHSGYSAYDTYEYGPGGYRSDKVFLSLPGGADGEQVYNLLHDLNYSAWEQVARANFGDHATVTATTEGFNVEYYEHD